MKSNINTLISDSFIDGCVGRHESTSASKEVTQEVNTQKNKYMLMSRNQNTLQSHDIKIVNRSSENVEKFKYLGMTVTNQNLIHEEIKSGLNSDNICYH
jgi:rRNA maturation endonuclease Nob1